jgi:shikimate dehydrogenase
LTKKLRSGELHGLNVTIPHKETVTSRLDHLTAAAAAAGAVNTIYWDGTALVGENTDVPGFLAGLAELPLSSQDAALVLGAGGAARAVVSALALSWRRIFITTRRLDQAKAVAEQIFAVSRPDAAGLQAVEIVPLPFVAAALGEATARCNLIVNATPIGMSPEISASPWPGHLPFPASAAVYDLVYNPRDTAFIQSARRAGVPAVGGLTMLVEQAALSFERWTGQHASRTAMRAAVLETYPSE